MRKQRANQGTRINRVAFRQLAFLLAAMVGLASCSAPVGVAPNLHGTYWRNALVTHPNGGGPEVVRWGPPDNNQPQHD
jgi:hypothetical protein